MAKTFDEATITGKTRVSDDDVVDRALLGACASKADNDRHLVLLIGLD
jgi:hypothetical protein